MSEHTTPITVHLTDEQMDDIVLYWGNRSAPDSAIRALIRDAIKAQRPRPIKVGDRVIAPTGGAPIVLVVEATKDGIAWLWYDGSPRGSHHINRLTRVDDEATP